MGTHCRILALENPMDRGVWRAGSPWCHKESGTTERLISFVLFL